MTGGAARSISFVPRDPEGARSAIALLRDSHPRATSIADELDAALDRQSVSEETLAQHSRWCNTDGSWSAGLEPARQAAQCLYGAVPERLLDEEGRPIDRYDAALGELAETMGAVWEDSSGDPGIVPGTHRMATGEAVDPATARAEWARVARPC